MTSPALTPAVSAGPLPVTRSTFRPSFACTKDQAMGAVGDPQVPQAVVVPGHELVTFELGGLEEAGDPFDDPDGVLLPERVQVAGVQGVREFVGHDLAEAAGDKHACAVHVDAL